ncbi:MAG: hypothetical protein E6Q95_01445 [Chitinophagaceae bacterium]|nr:MAG: hypothetical protein E6Q95_01445 [Chitinophagaceae bacterium]
MVGLFKQKNSSNIVTLFLLAFFLKLPIFLSVPKPILRANDGPIYKWLMIFLNEVYTVFPVVISFIVLSIHITIALLIARLINNNKFVVKPNFLSAMSYILISSFIKEFNYLSAPLIATLLLVLSFISIYNTYHQSKSNNNILLAGFLIGLAALVFTPAFGLTLGVFICLAVLKPFKLNEWLVLALGIICPFYFYGSFLYLTDQWNRFILYSAVILLVLRFKVFQFSY